VRIERRRFAAHAPIRYLGAMRTFTVIATLIALALAAWSCGGSSKPSPSPTAGALASPTLAAKSPAAPTAAARTPSASASAAPGTVDEVTGIVGVVNTTTNTIQIDRLSGAPVRKITVDAATVIRRVSGDTITLGEVRISDRIVASGHLNDRQDALVATHVTVQDVLPGAQPGG